MSKLDTIVREIVLSEEDHVRTKQQIKDLMLELVDYTHPDVDMWNADKQVGYERKQAELRQKVNEL